MIYFLDSSAIVKRYISEAGSGWVQSLAGNIVIAQITKIEVMSAVMRRVREGALPLRTAKAIQVLLNRHYSVISLSSQVMTVAESLLMTHPIRAYDSVQLASALVADQSLIKAGLSSLNFVSADARLLLIAGQEDLTTTDPNRYP